jgi:uncharacterized membrane protein YagU involved in acid resistance
MTSQRSPVKGLILGSLSGLVGTILMTQFQILWKKASEQIPARKHNKPEGKEFEEEKEDSTMKTAEKISEAVGYRLSHAEKKKAGDWAHYSFGAAMGGIFGLLKETGPQSLRRLNPAIWGASYGSVIFVSAHEIVVPALKLGSNPLTEPLPDQVSEYFAHIIYGVGTSLTYSAIRKT